MSYSHITIGPIPERHRKPAGGFEKGPLTFIGHSKIDGRELHEIHYSRLDQHGQPWAEQLGIRPEDIITSQELMELHIRPRDYINTRNVYDPRMYKATLSAGTYQSRKECVCCGIRTDLFAVGMCETCYARKKRDYPERRKEMIAMRGNPIDPLDNIQ